MKGTVNIELEDFLILRDNEKNLKNRNHELLKEIEEVKNELFTYQHVLYLAANTISDPTGGNLRDYLAKAGLEMKQGIHPNTAILIKSNGR